MSVMVPLKKIHIKSLNTSVVSSSVLKNERLRFKISKREIPINMRGPEKSDLSGRNPSKTVHKLSPVSFESTF